MFTRVQQLSLSPVRSNRYIIFHNVSLRYISLLPSHLRLGPPPDLPPSYLPTKILYALTSCQAKQHFSPFGIFFNLIVLIKNTRNYVQYFLTLVLFTFSTCCILRCLVCIVVSCLVCIVIVVLCVLL